MMAKVRGALGIVGVAAAFSACSAGEGGIGGEEVGEVSEALCSTTKAIAPASAQTSPIPADSQFAIDGNVNTVWRVSMNVPPKLTVDLGKFAVLSKLQLNWASSCAKDYDVQISVDKSKWIPVASVRGNSGAGIREVAVLSVKARYVRLLPLVACNPVVAGTPTWIELRELTAFGDAATNCLKADGAECTAPSECAAARCDVWYKGDTDGDGYGATASPKKYCGETVEPAGYVSTKKDCCEGDVDAHPGQTAYFDEKTGCGNFDYDCDGWVEAEYPQGSHTCREASKTCSLDNEGFADPGPNCGQEGNYIRLCSYSDAFGCVDHLVKKVKRCR